MLAYQIQAGVKYSDSLLRDWRISNQFASFFLVGLI